MPQNAMILVAALAIVLVIIVSSVSVAPVQISSTLPSGVINYHSNVCVSHGRDGKTLFQECKSNVFTTRGKNMARDILGYWGNVTGSGIPTFIAIGNESVAAVGDTALDQEYSDSGLTRAAGTYITDTANTGNWSIQKTFTSTVANKDVNGTGLFNNSGTDNSGLFAINNFTKVTLQNNDQINVTWTIWVT